MSDGLNQRQEQWSCVHVVAEPYFIVKLATAQVANS